jgi:hypothetical protein
MAFIMILLMLFMYIFAVAGTIIFDSYSKSTRTDLVYRDSFRYVERDHYLITRVLLCGKGIGARDHRSQKIF